MIQVLADFLNGLHITGSVRYAVREARFSAEHRREQARQAREHRSMEVDA